VRKSYLLISPRARVLDSLVSVAMTEDLSADGN